MTKSNIIIYQTKEREINMLNSPYLEWSITNG